MNQESSQPPFPGVSLEPLPRDPQRALPLAPPRLRRAERQLVVMRPSTLDELLPPDHAARIVWEVVRRWDLGHFLVVTKARGETAGRAATDPLILISLWLYAYVQGISNGGEGNL